MLTDDQILNARNAIKTGDGWDGDQWDLALARAIESLANQEKDKRIAELEGERDQWKSLCELHKIGNCSQKIVALEAMTDGQREVITDLEDRLEKAQALLKEFTDAVEVLAFSIPAPNDYTPAFMQMCVIARNRLQPSQSQVSDATRIAELEAALEAVAIDILHKNHGPIIDTLWHDDAETVIDFIGNTLGRDVSALQSIPAQPAKEETK